MIFIASIQPVIDFSNQINRLLIQWQQHNPQLILIHINSCEFTSIQRRFSDSAPSAISGRPMPSIRRWWRHGDAGGWKSEERREEMNIDKFSQGNPKEQKEDRQENRGKWPCRSFVMLLSGRNTRWWGPWRRTCGVLYPHMFNYAYLIHRRLQWVSIDYSFWRWLPRDGAGGGGGGGDCWFLTPGFRPRILRWDPIATFLPLDILSICIVRRFRDEFVCLIGECCFNPSINLMIWLFIEIHETRFRKMGSLGLEWDLCKWAEILLLMTGRPFPLSWPFRSTSLSSFPQHIYPS